MGSLNQPSPNAFVFGDFNVHHKNSLTYSAGKDQPGELCYNFSNSNDLIQMVYFLTQIPNCDSHSPDYSHADLDGFGDHFRDVPWEDIFKLGASAAPSEFCKWVPVGNDVQSLIKNIRSSLIHLHSAACAPAIVQRNHFFRLHQMDKSSDSKSTFRQTTNCWTRVLEAAKLAYANKTKGSITSKKLSSQDFW